MRRDVDLSEISDNRRYRANDMVKISCNDCSGCSKCCRDMGKSIILDPYDINELTKALGKTFDELLTGDYPIIELAMVDGLLLPNIKMHEDRGCCSLLSEEGRCTIHSHRPGFCRLFPLGRIYDDGGFEYFNQIYECDYPTKSKIKVKKWLGIDDISAYEHFVLKWHDYMDNLRAEIADISDVSEVSKIMVGFLARFYRKEYRPDESFFNQVLDRINM